jgi:hypothetical protein
MVARKCRRQYENGVTNGTEQGGLAEAERVRVGQGDLDGGLGSDCSSSR